MPVVCGPLAVYLAKCVLGKSDRCVTQGLSDRNFNLVFFSISESPAGAAYRNRLRNDYEAVSFKSLDDDLSSA